MANAIWQATITDQSGNILPGAEVSVINETTGLSAPLFSTRTGTAKSNPFFADANGFAQFYAEPGLYRITATSGGTGTTQTWRYVRLVDVATTAEAISGTAGVLLDAAGGHSAIRGLAVGTVSQSGGVPTGAIIESGSNANGYYVKYADGTMICTKSFSDISVQPKITRIVINWDFPAAFASRNNLAVSGYFYCIEEGIDFRQGIILSHQINPATSSYQQFIGRDIDGGLFDVYSAGLIASGRWY